MALKSICRLLLLHLLIHQLGRESVVPTPKRLAARQPAPFHFPGIAFLSFPLCGASTSICLFHGHSRILLILMRAQSNGSNRMFINQTRKLLLLPFPSPKKEIFHISINFYGARCALAERVNTIRR